MPPRTQKLVFPGAHGVELAGRLELPRGQVRAYALFAHCFTCGKDVAAATRVSRALAARGFGVLRFDFTGLGNSDGDFANTSFSSNVTDLVAAAAYLAEHHGAPRLLVGHSLGGAAVLVAARRIESVEAVVTIGAPSDPAHIREHLDVAQIDAVGAAEVHLGGRRFQVRREFLADLDEHNLGSALGALGKALLVMHSPADHVVPIVHAERIYKAARGFKSFVSLADADHMLSKASDAEYAADVLAAWAKRYVTFDEGVQDARADAEVGLVRVEELGVKFTNRVTARAHELLGDEPRKVGGQDAGPAPYEFLMAALGTCTSMTVRMYADHKGWPLERIAVDVEHSKVEVAGAAPDAPKAKQDLFVRTLELSGPLDAEQRARLLEIANKCPVHRTLEGAKEIRTVERP
ncbi:MAG: bifunctional alpha/beta hydrolase/OsmC family protein [Planctomycetota bacterium]